MSQCSAIVLKTSFISTDFEKKNLFCDFLSRLLSINVLNAPNLVMASGCLFPCRTDSFRRFFDRFSTVLLLGMCEKAEDCGDRAECMTNKIFGKHS